MGITGEREENHEARRLGASKASFQWGKKQLPNEKIGLLWDRQSISLEQQAQLAAEQFPSHRTQPVFTLYGLFLSEGGNQRLRRHTSCSTEIIRAGTHTNSATPTRSHLSRRETHTLSPELRVFLILPGAAASLQDKV